MVSNTDNTQTPVPPKRDAAVEKWLQKEVATTYDAMQADPDRALSAESVFSNLRARHVVNFPTLNEPEYLAWAESKIQNGIRDMNSPKKRFSEKEVWKELGLED
ncbi:MAG: hypothetical protein ACPGOY_12420 [Rhodospirillaceae bacterium]